MDRWMMMDVLGELMEDAGGDSGWEYVGVMLGMMGKFMWGHDGVMMRCDMADDGMLGILGGCWGLMGNDGTAGGDNGGVRGKCWGDDGR